MDKFVHELTQADLVAHPVWFFPMDGSVTDETVVRPARNEDISADYRIVVATDFHDQNGVLFMGYLYWGKPESVEYIQPVIVGPTSCITFWNGPGEPSKNYLNRICHDFPELAWPVEFRTRVVPSLGEISGSLDGVYYLGEDGKARCYRPIAT